MTGMIADHLWQSTLFVAIAALLTIALRKNGAEIRYWIWLAASMKFLVPFAALVAVGSQFEWRPVAPIAPPGVTSVIDTVSQPFTQMLLSEASAAPAVRVSRIAAGLPFLLAAVWFAGFASILAIWYVRRRRIAHLIRVGSLINSGRVLTTLRRIEHLHGIRRPLSAISCDTTLEPGIFGMVKPLLLWPRGVDDRMTDDQIEAILVHELAHVRRRDNLSAALHTVVEAAFWFHPLVWWIGMRLAHERERACDDDVLQSGSQPQTYAESILKTCEFCVEAPASCMAGVTGSDLKKRIEQIMRRESARALTRRRKALLTTAALVAVVAPVAAGILRGPHLEAQTPTAAAPALAFDVASIKPNKSGRADILMQVQPGGRINVTNASLRILIRNAYRLQDSQIVGGPAWMGADRFDIVAKAEGNPTPTQIQEMLRALLAERFKLAVHDERRELTVYALVRTRIDGNIGPQMRAAAPCFRMPANMPPPTAPPPDETPCGFRLRPGWMQARAVTMAALAGSLANQVTRFVVDRTGLAGEFDLELEWTPFQRPASPDAPAAADDRPVDAGPSIFTAVQEQLGLRLESDRAPVDVVVVDSAERPGPD
jgi:bla regulator protein BlaR1